MASRPLTSPPNLVCKTVSTGVFCKHDLRAPKAAVGVACGRAQTSQYSEAAMMPHRATRQISPTKGASDSDRWSVGLKSAPSRRPKRPAHRVADAVFYVLRSECPWRMAALRAPAITDGLLPLPRVASRRTAQESARAAARSAARGGGTRLLEEGQGLPRTELLWADGAYTGGFREGSRHQP